MNDMPFGFAANNNENANDKDGNNKDGNNKDGNSAGANNEQPGGFDPAGLGDMLAQLGQMFTGMAQGVSSTGGEPVNYTVATQLARKTIGNFSPVSDGERSAISDSVRLVELWLDAASAFPASVNSIEAWSPVDWLEKTLPTWKILCDPVATQLSSGMTKSLPTEAAAMLGPMMGMISSMGSMTFGTQLGNALGQLSKEVLTSTDIGIPLAPSGTAVLLPEAIAAFSDGLELPNRDIIVFLAAREAAHVRLFAQVPWLRQQLFTTVDDYARGIAFDFSGLEDVAISIDPTELMQNPERIQELLSDAEGFDGEAILKPKTTENQQVALKRLETLLALIEGWVEAVVSDALNDRITSAGVLVETLRRRRASGGPAEQTFASLIGLELRPKKLREAADLWRKVLAATDVTQRDQVWSHPDLLPDASDLDNPAAFIDRLLGGTSEFDDPIAEIEKTIAREQAEKSGENPPENS